MGHQAALSVVKAKRTRRESGRFVTLKSGRVIFIPATGGTRWADVRDKVLASQKKGRKSLSEVVTGEPVKSRRTTSGESGIEDTFVNTYEDGTRVLLKINEHGSAESELLAYEFSESIGWGVVPETVISKEHGAVSIQRWVEGRTPYEIEATDADPRMRVMDVLLQNDDRHINNILVDGNGKQWAIDNNLAFQAEGQKYYYTAIRGWLTTRPREANVDLAEAAGDVARWHGTPAYWEYVGRVRETIGDDVARQFKENVRALAEWSGVGG